ncbi:MAG: hypothetical protein ABJB73_08735 [Candidatus Nitrosocosmicus sp.]
MEQSILLLFFNSPFLYESGHLKNTINKYVNFTKLQGRTGQQQQS